MKFFCGGAVMEAISRCEVEICAKRAASQCSWLNCNVVARKPWMPSRAGDNLTRMRSDTSNGVCLTQHCANKDRAGWPAKVMPDNVGLMQLQTARVSLQRLPAAAPSSQQQPLTCRLQVCAHKWSERYRRHHCMQLFHQFQACAPVLMKRRHLQ